MSRGLRSLLAGLLLLPASCVKKQAPVPKLSPCEASYLELYQHDPLKVMIAFGYKDARPRRFVGDRYERNALVDRLTSDCKPGESACGFTRDSTDAERFYKAVATRSGKSHRVELVVLNSSIGADDDVNRRDPRQAIQSARIATAFYRGFREFDVIFYNGHSRDGGGPDFFPPRLNSAQSVDFPYYRKNKPGVAELWKSLAAATPRARVLGLFSCASSKHFDSQIATRAPKLSTISTNTLLFYADARENLLRALSAILEQRCPGDLNQAEWRRF